MPMGHVAGERKKLLARVNRIAGQLNALKQAIESADGTADCNAVMQQIASIRGAMNGLLLHFLAEHIKEHVALGTSKDRRLEEADVVIEAVRAFRT